MLVNIPRFLVGPNKRTVDIKINQQASLLQTHTGAERNPDAGVKMQCHYSRGTKL